MAGVIITRMLAVVPAARICHLHPDPLGTAAGGIELDLPEFLDQVSSLVANMSVIHTAHIAQPGYNVQCHSLTFRILTLHFLWY